MRACALYIEGPPYLFHGPSFVNLGGKWEYSINIEDRNSDDKRIVNISRELNESYVSDFYEIEKSEVKISSLNAIVGDNGSGKSTILNIIQTCIKGGRKSIPESVAFMVFEIDESDEIKIITNNPFFDFSIKWDLSTRKSDILDTSEYLQSIFYSPQLHFNAPPAHSGRDVYDISLDRKIESILDANVSPPIRPISIIDEIHFLVSKLQYQFLLSDFIRDHDVLRETFGLNKDIDPRITINNFRDYDLLENSDLDFFISSIESILRSDSIKNRDSIDKYTKLYTDELNEKKYIFKRNFIANFFYSFSIYLRKSVPFSFDLLFDDRIDINASVNDIIAKFIKSIYLRNSQNQQMYPVLDSVIVTLFITKLFEKVDLVSDIFSLDRDFIIISPDSSIELFDIHQRALQSFAKLQRKELQSSYSKKIPPFLSFSANEKKFSTGEANLLNLFSFFYDFVLKNISEESSSRRKSNYLILIDEGDTSFHPAWKKKIH